mmetsp:Transcript_57244/g.129704  ORF Transcript_57244/g.129704 Transcript_57244/m.129704 type:complete len:278 (-) Transcript_57244:294-1127(-)
MKVRPPARCSSRFSTGFTNGSKPSASCTMSGVPNRMAEARALMKLSSRKLVWAMRLGANLASKNRVAAPAGSMTSGNRALQLPAPAPGTGAEDVARSRTTAFSMHRSSDGRPSPNQPRRCEAFERNSASDSSLAGVKATPRASTPSRHCTRSPCRVRWSNTPPQVAKQAPKIESPTTVRVCCLKPEAASSHRPCSELRDASSVSARPTLALTASSSTLIASMSRIAPAYSCLKRSMSSPRDSTALSAASFSSLSSADCSCSSPTSALKGATRATTAL